MLMITPTSTPPPVGTVGIGELLADAQTRTIWLGVDPAIDAAQAVLLADMLATENGIDQCLADSKAYTDTGIATRAPTVHRHEISDINGLEDALSGGGASGIPIGMIAIWHGTIITIPAGWVLCDGTNGTPDLKDKFVMGGGGGRLIGSTGGAFSLTGFTDDGGDHSHGGATLGTVLTASHLPAHTHPVSDPGHAHSVYDPTHTHSVPGGGGGVAVPIGSPSGAVSATQAAQNAGYAATGISLYAAVTGISLASVGGNVAHTHPISASGNHKHALSNISTLPPYYVLAFIMRIG